MCIENITAFFNTTQSIHVCINTSEIQSMLCGKIADLSKIKLAIIFGTANSRVGHDSVSGEY
jgi:hypothetical protein